MDSHCAKYVNLCITLYITFGSIFLSCVTAQDSLDRDYEKELPSVAPTEPADAITTFNVLEGYQIELVASEPLVTDPIAMSFDEKGRLYVIEMRGYSEHGGDSLGRIRLLEDTNHDGKFDKSTLFCEQLSWPTAITCFEGGVFVGAAPHIYYLKDNDGDGVSDQKEVLFSGFGRSNVQGLMNTFRWGPDNRIHGATSSSGAKIKLNDGSTVTLRGRDFSFDPKSVLNSKLKKIRPESGGGQHGWDFDRFGNKFVCSNSDHVQWVTYPESYLSGNPFISPLPTRKSIAADGPQAEVFRASPVEPWRIVRTRLRVQKIVGGPVEGGGRAAGYFTGSTGLTLFEGTAWPAGDYGNAIVADVGSNLIHRKKLTRSGIEFVANRIDPKTEFVTSKDIWFRPVQFENGPEGALYVADMYREVIEHPKSLPPVIKKHLDLNRGRDRGRIYRIVKKDFRQPEHQDLSSQSTAELVEQLRSPNKWNRVTASRLLYQRKDPAKSELLRSSLGELLRRSHAGQFEDFEGAIIATARGLFSNGPMTEEDLIQLLNARSPNVRKVAMELSESMADKSTAKLTNRLYSMAGDPNPVVRFQLALSIGQFPQEKERNRILVKLLQSSRSDSARDKKWTRFAILSSLGKGGAGFLLQLSAKSKDDLSPFELNFVGDLSRGELRKSDQAQWVQAIAKISSRPALIQQLLPHLGIAKSSKVANEIDQITKGSFKKMLNEVLQEARETVSNGALALDVRKRALETLSTDDFESNRPMMESLMNPNSPAELQKEVLSLMQGYSDPRIGKLIAQRLSNMTPSVKRLASQVAFSRNVWASELLSAVEKKTIPRSDVTLPQTIRDAKLRLRSQQIFGSIRSDRNQLVLDYLAGKELVGNEQAGKKIFEKHCASCHKVKEIGKEIGPNLPSAALKGSDYLVTNILDPNREVTPDFVTYSVSTIDGRNYSGMIRSETATSIVLVTSEHKPIELLRADIEEMSSTGLSLMPEGLEKEIDKQQMADLLMFLKKSSVKKE